MPTLLHLVDLITSDTLTLTATGILAVAVLALLVLIAWPSRAESTRGGSGRGAPSRSGRARIEPPHNPVDKARASTARTLAASGTAIVDIARRTGLSRDALALMSAMSGKTGPGASPARQKAPAAARLSLFQRWRGATGERSRGVQVPAC